MDESYYCFFPNLQLLENLLLICLDLDLGNWFVLLLFCLIMILLVFDWRLTII
jgi:hypothetical protein